VRNAASPDAVVHQALAMVPLPGAIDAEIRAGGSVVYTMTCTRCRLDQVIDAFYTGPNRLSRTPICEGCRELEEPAFGPRANAARTRAAARLITEYQDRYHELVEEELENDSPVPHRGIRLRLRPHPKKEN
jgi:hypothetical protein